MKNKINDTILEMYIFETHQQLEQLEQIILTYGDVGKCDPEIINEIFRIMHSIKGSSAMMSYNNIALLAHAVEDLFFFIREDSPDNINCEIVSELVLESIDFIKIELEKVKAGDELNGDSEELINRFKTYLLEVKKKINEDKEVLVENDLKLYYYKAMLKFEEDCEMENVRCYTVLHSLEDVICEVACEPEDILNDELAAKKIRDYGFKLVFSSFLPLDQIKELLEKTIFLKGLKLEEYKTQTNFKKAYNLMTNSEKDNTNIDSINNKNENSEDIKQNKDPNDIIKLDGELNKRADDTKEVDNKESNHKEIPNKEITNKEIPNQSQKPTLNEHNNSVQTMISVNVEKLDKLMDLVGEMVISEAMVTQNPEVKALEIDSFMKASRQLHKITNELQDMVMAIRMLPLSKTFMKMQRIVHDMAKKLEKEVKLVLIGEETEVDKNIIEKISDPLMHLVRNSVDHGIENKNERIKSKKDPVGVVTLEAKNSGSDVLIIIRDDGSGLNKQKIIKKAKESGVLEKNENDMTDKEIYSLILLPGFSTNEDITEFSGRGVGMDVVAKNISNIGGSVSVDSKEGEGTVITLKIPLTLAIIDGMNVKVGLSRYTIPIISIKESFRPRNTDVFMDTDGNEMIMVRGECYKVIRLNSIYNVYDSVHDFEQGILIMVEQDDLKACLFADELLGQQQVVVKALPNYIKLKKNIKGIGGCTLLGDGSISLILDVAELISNRSSN